MTPKEKAIELFSKMASAADTFYTWEVKDCALIAVDEILVIMNEEYLSGADKITYWEQVHSEIENL